MKVYKGETSKSAYVRDKWHIRDWRQKNKTKFIIEHCIEDHPQIQWEDMKGNYYMEIERVDNKAMQRIVREGIRMKNTIDGEIRQIKTTNPHTR